MAENIQPSGSPYPGPIPAGTNPIAPGTRPPIVQAVAAGPPPAMPSPVDTRKKKPPPDYKDGAREVVETIVFVVVLVLLLKTFLAEAFVIPTGSMATTLLGYHKEVKCRQCKYPFLVNAHSEADPDPGQKAVLVPGGRCPNCGFYHRFPQAKQEVQP